MCCYITRAANAVITSTASTYLPAIRRKRVPRASIALSDVTVDQPRTSVIVHSRVWSPHKSKWAEMRLRRVHKPRYGFLIIQSSNRRRGTLLVARYQRRYWRSAQVCSKCFQSSCRRRRGRFDESRPAATATTPGDLDTTGYPESGNGYSGYNN